MINIIRFVDWVEGYRPIRRICYAYPNYYKPDFPSNTVLRHIRSMRMTTEQNFNSTAAFTAHLPAVYKANNDYNVLLRNIGRGTLIKHPNGGELIDGASIVAGNRSMTFDSLQRDRLENDFSLGTGQ